MPADYFQPGTFHFLIPQGQHFHLELPTFVDADTGQPFDFPADGGWTAKMDVLSTDGSTVITRFATSGQNGTITLGSDGIARLDLIDDYTLALPATTGLGLLADFVLVDPDTGENWLWFKGRGKVTRKVTS